jgi:hypothetical protein
MEGIVTSTVPGLEGEAAMEGTARGVAIGAANYWHARFEAVDKHNRDLLAADNVSRLAWFVIGSLVTAVGFVATWLVLR